MRCLRARPRRLSCERTSSATLPQVRHKKTPRRGGVFSFAGGAKASAAERSASLARALRPLLCFVDAQRSAIHLKAVQRLDRCLGLRLGHLDETEAARLASLAVVDEFHRIHLAVTFKQSLHVLLGGIEGQIAHINRRHWEVSL